MITTFAPASLNISAKRAPKPLVAPPAVGGAKEKPPEDAEERTVIEVTKTWSAREVLRARDFSTLTEEDLPPVGEAHPAATGGEFAPYVIDYGLGGNGLDPSSLLRDYLVQVHPADPDLLLGHAFLAIVGLRIPVSYFVLRRARSHDFHG